MDTYTQSVSGAVAKSRHRTIAEKRQIVEETMVEGASVARSLGLTGSTPIRFSTGACSIEKDGWEGEATAAAGPSDI